MDKILLLGYMGAGKSTIARLLGQKLQISSIDLDSEIESRANLPISQIFSQKGEIYFRKLEHKVFVDLLEQPGKKIIALGGGTPCYSGNHLLMNQQGISIYLKASIDTLYERLQLTSGTRPLWDENRNTKEFLAKHLFDRSYYYHQAEFVISTDNKSIEQITHEIASLLA